MPNEIELVVTGSNKSQQVFQQVQRDTTGLQDTVTKTGKSFTDMGQSAKKSSTVTSQGLTGVQKDLKSVGTEAQATGKEIQKAGKEAESSGNKLSEALGDKAKDKASEFGGAIGSVGDILGKLGPIGMAAGAAIGVAFIGAEKAFEVLKDSLKASIERTQAADMVSAQLGASQGQTAQIAKISGKIYADNFASSIDEASQTLRQAIVNGLIPQGATDDFTTKISEQLSTVASLFETDAGDVAKAAANMVKTGLADSSTTALNVLVKGLQLGDNKAGDLLDTFNEYSVQFKKLGIDGQTALGLINQGLQAGARDSDLVADAIKEFSIRAVDGSKTTIDGFKSLGLNAKQTAGEIAKGGQSAEDAFGKVIEKLRGVKDPVERSRIAVELFGTQAEDLGSALYALDTKTATKGIGDIGNAAEKAGNQMSDNWGAKLDQAKKTFENFKADLGDKLFAKLGPELEKMGNEILPVFQSALKDIAKTWHDNQDGIKKFEGFLKDMEPFVKDFIIGSIEAISFAIQQVTVAIGFFGDAWVTVKPYIKETILFILQNFKDIIDGAEAAFGWMPGLGGKLKAARKSFDSEMDSIINKINSVPPAKTVDITLKVGATISNLAASLIGGAAASAITGLKKHASGGIAGGNVIMNDAGPEAVRLPQGSTVIPAGATQNMMNGLASGNNGGTFRFIVDASGAGEFGRAVAAILRDYVHIQGGDGSVIGISHI